MSTVVPHPLCIDVDHHSQQQYQAAADTALDAEQAGATRHDGGNAVQQVLSNSFCCARRNRPHQAYPAAPAQRAEMIITAERIMRTLTPEYSAASRSHR